MNNKKFKYFAFAIGLFFVLAAGCIVGVFYGISPVKESGGSLGEDTGKSGAEEAKNSLRTHIPDEVLSVIQQKERIKIRLKQDGSTVSGEGANVSGNTVTISKGGNYQISGTLEEGQIYVKVSGDDIVVLALSGADITNLSAAAVHVENAGYTAVLLEDGTNNRIQSGEVTEITGTGTKKATGQDTTDQETDNQDGVGGALYARDDLAITGTGTLEVYGYLNNGIHTTNNLLVDSGVFRVKAVNNGIKGKDSVSITGGDFSVISDGDGIKSDDTTGESYGVISLTGGTFSIESAGDGVQAETVLDISGGDFTVKTGDGSEDVKFSSQHGWGQADSGWDMEDEAQASVKGFKSGTQMKISDGTFSVDSQDDAFHCNGNMAISGGKLDIASGDDGVHADKELTVNDGEITVTRSYEGLEANQIYIQGGDISIVSSDDGMNAYGGQNNRGRSQSGKTTEETPNLCITGGDISLNANGDGLDSNGNITIEGGSVIVDGPSGNGNGAIDYGSEEGGTCTVNGGTVIAVGGSGMAETFDEASKQHSFRHNFEMSFEAGDKIVISDEKGKELFRHTAVKEGDSVVFSCPKLSQGGKYVLRAGEQSAEITLESVSTLSGQQGGWEGPGRDGGGKTGGDRPGGGRPDEAEGFARGGRRDDNMGGSGKQQGDGGPGGPKLEEEAGENSGGNQSQ